MAPWWTTRTGATGPCAAGTPGSTGASSPPCCPPASTAGRAVRPPPPGASTCGSTGPRPPHSWAGSGPASAVAPMPLPVLRTWDRRGDLAGRAVRLIADGEVERSGVAGLAHHLAVSERHLHRVLLAEVGAGALALARSQRATTARITRRDHGSALRPGGVRLRLLEHPAVQRHRAGRVRRLAHGVAGRRSAAKDERPTAIGHRCVRVARPGVGVSERCHRAPSCPSTVRPAHRCSPSWRCVRCPGVEEVTHRRAPTAACSISQEDRGS
jgi:hypothetical protein